MNIFYLSKNSKKCARYHSDKHVVKMILETAQLLCTAIWLSGGKAPYKATHKNHPSAKWARTSKANWNWLYSLGVELCKEYTYRYNKIHKSQTKVYDVIECPSLPTLPFQPPPQAMPDEYKKEYEDKICIENKQTLTIVAYRDYYIYKNKVLASPLSWKKRRTPKWFLRRLLDE